MISKYSMKFVSSNILISLVFLQSVHLLSQNSTEFYRLKETNDSLLIVTRSHLTTQVPTELNGQEYYELATALWRVKQNSIAENMFREIEKSEILLFGYDKVYKSDISGDTIQNKYGYGSFTFNYKNRACIYLTKILIEKGDFKNAHQFLLLADKKYHVVYNDGTGHYRYRKQIDEMYGLCYEGFGQFDKVIQLLIFNSLSHTNNNEILVRNIKRVYSKEQIQTMKEVAISSIEFELNKEKSYAETIYNYGMPNEKVEKRTYLTGKGTILLFGYRVALPIPDLENGETVTMNDFINEFTDSDFYNRLYSKL